MNKQQGERKIEDDLICPISRELPVDPVMAEDGRIYERSELYRYMMTMKNGPLRSPVTNERMGGTLITAHQHKSHIETLIERNIITGEVARTWLIRAKGMKWKDIALKGNGGKKTVACLSSKIDELMAKIGGTHLSEVHIYSDSSNGESSSRRRPSTRSKRVAPVEENQRDEDAWSFANISYSFLR